MHLKVSNCFFHGEFVASLFLDTLNVIVYPFWQDDVTQIGDQISVDSNHFDQSGMIRAQNIDNFDAKRFDVESGRDLTDVHQNLESILV